MIVHLECFGHTLFTDEVRCSVTTVWHKVESKDSRRSTFVRRERVPRHGFARSTRPSASTGTMTSSDPVCQALHRSDRTEGHTHLHEPKAKYIYRRPVKGSFESPTCSRLIVLLNTVFP